MGGVLAGRPHCDFSTQGDFRRRDYLRRLGGELRPVAAQPVSLRAGAVRPCPGLRVAERATTGLAENKRGASLSPLRRLAQSPARLRCRGRLVSAPIRRTLTRRGERPEGLTNFNPDGPDTIFNKW